jgi:hypothetical protein
MLFVVKNRNEFTLNSEIYEINTRQQGNLHQSLPNFRKYQKGIYYIGTKVYNKLPLYIKNESKDLKKFEAIFTNTFFVINYKNIFVINYFNT